MDEVINDWIIEVVSNATITSINLNPSAESEEVLDAGTCTTSHAIGIDGNTALSAYAATDIISRDCRTEGRVVSEVSATGIDAGGGDVEVINTGLITVLGGADAQVTSSAYSRDQNPTAEAHATAIGTVHGIRTGAGNDFVVNSGTVSVTLSANALPWASANSVSRTTDTDVFAGSQATAAGIAVGA
ncbi:MAG: hypothetical protein LJE94_04250, partial [Deltaproteobacteria bacterium]|nr:hypothetical protein [Deltaproteobacteria bacterium]